MFAARVAIFETLITGLAAATGAWEPCPTQLHRASFVITDEPNKSDEQRAPEVFDSVNLTYERAKALDGKQITVRVRLISIEGGTHDQRVLYSCRVEGNNNFWVLFFDDNRPKDGEIKRELFVKGRLKAYPSEPINGREIPAQVVLTDSKIVKR